MLFEKVNLSKPVYKYYHCIGNTAKKQPLKLQLHNSGPNGSKVSPTYTSSQNPGVNVKPLLLSEGTIGVSGRTTIDSEWPVKLRNAYERAGHRYDVDH